MQKVGILGAQRGERTDGSGGLMRFPQGYVLGASDKVKDPRRWLTTDVAEAETEYRRMRGIMWKGNPLAE